MPVAKHIVAEVHRTHTHNTDVIFPRKTANNHAPTFSASASATPLSSRHYHHHQRRRQPNSLKRHAHNLHALPHCHNFMKENTGRSACVIVEPQATRTSENVRSLAPNMWVLILTSLLAAFRGYFHSSTYIHICKMRSKRISIVCNLSHNSLSSISCAQIADVSYRNVR